MRTRSGSLAAVMARVPSHPAHSGVLCVFAASASSRPAQTVATPASTRLKGDNALSRHHRRWKFSAWLAVALSDTTGSFNTGVGAGALVLNRVIQIPPLALLRCCSISLAVGTRRSEQTRWSLTRQPGNGSFNGAFGAFALFNNIDGFSNNAFGDSALFRNISCRCEHCRWRSGAGEQ